MERVGGTKVQGCFVFMSWLIGAVDQIRGCMNAMLIQLYTFIFLLFLFVEGWCFVHSLIAIVVSYLLLHIVGPSMIMVVLIFLFNMVGIKEFLCFFICWSFVAHVHVYILHLNFLMHFGD